MNMALANTAAAQSLLADAIKRGDLAKQLFTDRRSFLDPDPWPLYVRYDHSETVFVPRDRFYFRDPDGPSACLWIVPGSAAR
jgi:hypothetical protein